MNQSLLRKLRKGHRTLGLEITDDQVKLCEVQEKGRNEISVQQYGSQTLPEGTVTDGRINHMEQLKEAIRSLMSQHKFNTRYVHFALPSQLAMIRIIKLPDLSQNELKKLVHFEMKHNLNVAFEEPYFDFIKLPKQEETTEEPADVSNDPLNMSMETKPQDKKLCDVLVVAASMELLQQINDMLFDLNLIPCSIEIKAFSLLRLLEKSKLSMDDALMVVDVNSMNSELTIVENGVFKITRNVEVQFKAIRNDKEGQNLWLDQFSTPEQTFTNATQDLVSEIERLINFYYYTMKKNDKTIQRIMLSGDLPEMDKLHEGLSNRLEQLIIPIEWDQIPVEGDQEGWRTSKYAVPFGLALRGKQG